MPPVLQTHPSTSDRWWDPSRLHILLSLPPLARKARPQPWQLQGLHGAMKCQGPPSLCFPHQHHLHPPDVFPPLSSSGNQLPVKAAVLVPRMSLQQGSWVAPHWQRCVEPCCEIQEILIHLPSSGELQVAPRCVLAPCQLQQRRPTTAWGGGW